MAASLNQRRVGIALGESARETAIVDTSAIDNAEPIGRFDPGFRARPVVQPRRPERVDHRPTVPTWPCSVRDHQSMFRVPVGPPPQHIAFYGRYMYLTSVRKLVEHVRASTGS
jgi:hypothetical protein